MDAAEEAVRESLEQKTLLEVMEEKIDELVKEWCQKYGEKLNYKDLLEKFF
jgi:uncharacterized protein YecA (UPF0149 family)